MGRMGVVGGRQLAYGPNLLIAVTVIYITTEIRVSDRVPTPKHSVKWAIQDFVGP